jgi:hypothetical protein
MHLLAGLKNKNREIDYEKAKPLLIYKMHFSYPVYTGKEMKHFN